jgi:hypothetical protein
MEHTPVQPPLIIRELTSEKRIAFYRKTYTHLALAVLLFILVEMIFFQIAFPNTRMALACNVGWIYDGH